MLWKNIRGTGYKIYSHHLSVAAGQKRNHHPLHQFGNKKNGTHDNHADSEKQQAFEPSHGVALSDVRASVSWEVKCPVCKSCFRVHPPSETTDAAKFANDAVGAASKQY